MFRKEIKFIYDFNLSQVRKLGSYLTYEQIKQTDIHPAILHYISAEIDYLIFEDRQKVLKDSIFDYSGETISGYFHQISDEIKKNKRFSIEFIAQLILHSSSFTVNYLARPRWALMKLIFEDDEHKSTTEIKQILNYVYYYGYLKKIITSYINRKKILSLDYDEFRDLLNKIDDLGFKSDYRVILNSALQSMANFFNIGEPHKKLIPLQSVELFLREKGLNAHLMKLKENFPHEEKIIFDISDYQKIFNTIRYEDSEEVDEVDRDLVEEETTPGEEEEFTQKEEKLEQPEFVPKDNSKIKINNIFGAPPPEEAVKEDPESKIENELTIEDNAAIEEKVEEEKEEIVESWAEESVDEESGDHSDDELVIVHDEQMDIDEQIKEKDDEPEKEDLDTESDKDEIVKAAFGNTEITEPEETEIISDQNEQSANEDDEDIVGESSEKISNMVEFSESEEELDTQELIVDDETEETESEMLQDMDEHEEVIEDKKPIDEPNEEVLEETKPVDETEEQVQEEIITVEEQEDKPQEETKTDDEQIEKVSDDIKSDDKPEEEIHVETKPVDDSKEEVQVEIRGVDEPEEKLQEEIKPVGTTNEEIDEDSKQDEEPKEELKEEMKPVNESKGEDKEEINAAREPEEEIIDEIDFIIDESQDENIIQLDTDEISDANKEPDDSDVAPAPEERSKDVSVSDDASAEIEKSTEEEPTLFDPNEKSTEEEVIDDTVLSEESEKSDLVEVLESQTAKDGIDDADTDFTDEEEGLSEFEEENVEKSESYIEDETVSNDESEIENSDKSKTDVERTKFEVSELLERKNMTRVIDVIFDYDIEDFANVIDRACRCENLAQANKVLDDLYARNQVSPNSKEAKTLRSVISDFFDRKEN